ncbi:MAG: glycosyltransferase family 4 protein [Balneolaceae bacterium]
MKILYLTQYYPPEVGAGAVRSNIMSNYLAKDGWEVDVVCERPNYPTGILDENYLDEWCYEEKVNENLTVHRIWAIANQRGNVWEQMQFFVSFMISSFFYVLMNPKKYDVIYVTSPPIFAAISGYFLSKILGGKFVFEVRDIWPDSAVNQIDLESESFFIKFGRRIENWLYHKADLIVPVTTEAEKIIRRRSNGTPTSVIPNGVDTEIFQKKANPQEGMDETYDPAKFRVGYVGSLGVIHDLRTFVKAAKLCEDHPDIEFIIVGDSGRNNKLQEILDEFNTGNVTWVGLKKHEQIPFYISSFDVAVNPVNPSKAFESIVTVKFYEYLACEVPVITCGKGLLKQIGDESGAAITVPPNDAEELADAILQLKRNYKQIRKLSGRGRLFVNDQYSRSRLAESLSRQLKKEFF